MSDLGFNKAELHTLLKNVDLLSEDEMHEVETMLEELGRRDKIQAAKDDLIAFCQYMDANYKVGRHHRLLADQLMDIETGQKDRICVNIPPRHGKSQLVSTYYPAWFIGRNPGKKVMLVSHTTDLAVDFGRKVRNIIDSEVYQEIYPNTKLSMDSKSAGRWNTSTGAEFYATGVGSALAGRGADLLLIDDPHSEQDILNGNFSAFDKAYDWFAFGARTRLMPGGRIAVVHTRWHANDLTGRLVQDMTNNEDSDQYEVVEYPAILEVEDKLTGEFAQKALWPEFFDLAALLRTKASMAAYQWNAQYQQNPTGEEAAIIKRDWWRLWPKEDPPAVEYIIMALDAAAEAHNRADFTSLTTWGVFYNEEESAHQIILLNAIKRRMEFPELKVLAMEEYSQWEPDAFIVEKKSSGTPLYQEMRRSGVMVQEYTPVRGTTNSPNTKMARLNSVSDIISSGLVWVPAKRWAEELIEEVAGFPFAKNDDHCFVAGTKVLMADGALKPIERIGVGEYVKTPAGPKVVLDAGFTGVRDTFTLRAGQCTLEGTGNHPIATTRGWKRLDTIAVTDTVKVTKQGVSAWHGRLTQMFARSLVARSFAGTRARVASLSAEKEKKPVYNLTVADAHCYYANGILVHNCDTTIMALMRFRQGGFITLDTDEPDEEMPYRQKVDYY